MIILGVDPALGSLGWAVIKAESSKLTYIKSGVIKTTTLTPLYLRLSYIVSKLELIINEYSPAIVSLEETFVNNNAVSSMKLGYVRGAIMALVGKHNLPLKEFKPNAVKKTMVGTGHADKNQIMHMVKLIFPAANNISSSDEADAIAIAYTCSVYG